MKEDQQYNKIRVETIKWYRRERYRELFNQTLAMNLDDSFFLKVLTQDDWFGYEALRGDTLLGAIIARKDQHEQSPTLYIDSLGVYQQYRKQGAGSQLIQRLLSTANQLQVQYVTVHTWETNSEALRLYQKFDFNISTYIQNFYDDFVPPHAYYLVKTLYRQQKYVQQ